MKETFFGAKDQVIDGRLTVITSLRTFAYRGPSRVGLKAVPCKRMVKYSDKYLAVFNILKSIQNAALVTCLRVDEEKGQPLFRHHHCEAYTSDSNALPPRNNDVLLEKIEINLFADSSEEEIKAAQLAIEEYFPKTPVHRIIAQEMREYSPCNYK